MKTCVHLDNSLEINSKNKNRCLVCSLFELVLGNPCIPVVAIRRMIEVRQEKTAQKIDLVVLIFLHKVILLAWIAGPLSR